MRLKVQPFLFLSLLSSLLLGCVSAEQTRAPETRSTTVVSGDTSYLEQSSGRYAWHPSLVKAYLHKTESEDLLLQVLQQNISKTMQDKGYTLVELNQQPDFFIGVGAALDSKVSDQQILARAGMMAGLSADDVDPTMYEKGSVMIALFNSAESEPFWRILSQGMAQQEQALSERKVRIAREVDRMLQYLPQR
ncbi:MULTISPECIES: DUF4136 domain-containing protein [unclassified Agarivorans]|uniref:DUF4136 domain-containing protein n=1 Tax=unclassified Agarivorans TaxID=2636026 RepID=UPI0026E1C068|nr:MULTISPECIES: DUF4136 domain-containing protein [unclassified Agarivorans]MDO6683984.1 DUF4136 domain-containing protein [Agarivorans sp. 3_MG-2023]MDO6714283.1 DUF4136 domain-containing protein [Agarivorans sp. 2_MG-2023]